MLLAVAGNSQLISTQLSLTKWVTIKKHEKSAVKNALNTIQLNQTPV